MTPVKISRDPSRHIIDSRKFRYKEDKQATNIVPNLAPIQHKIIQFSWEWIIQAVNLIDWTEITKNFLYICTPKISNRRHLQKIKSPNNGSVTEPTLLHSATFKSRDPHIKQVAVVVRQRWLSWAVVRHLPNCPDTTASERRRSVVASLERRWCRLRNSPIMVAVA